MSSEESAMSQDPMEEHQLQKELCEDSPCVLTSSQEPESWAEEAEELQTDVPQISECLLVEAGIGDTGEQAEPKSTREGLEEELSGNLVLDSTANLQARLNAGVPPEGEPQELCGFSCEHCERHFSTKQGLERHTHIHVSVNRRMHTFKCRYCGKTFGSQVGRRRHERRHENGPAKKVGQTSGPAASLGQPATQSDGFAPDSLSSPDGLVTNAPDTGRSSEVNSQTQKVSVASEVCGTSTSDENGELKELHPCKYCKKVFGTHTNMRRHQRRIHERHLLPKGVRRNGVFLKEAPKQPPVEGSASASPSVYVPSGDVEDEAAQEEYMVDISSNISENLSLYIDGKILSTSTVSNCEVIQLDSSSAALLGLDAFIINPEQISQVLKVDAGVCTVKEVPAQPVSKRRTATPPILPNVKTELESVPVLSSPTPAATSTSSAVAGAVFSQPTETLAFQKEKALYLSPKLKQLLQTQDGHKPASPLVTDKNRPGPPPPMAVLPAVSGRFKRRTASPPSSSQHGPVSSTKSAGVVSLGAKVPVGDCQCSGPAQSSDQAEKEPVCPSGVDTFNMTDIDWPSTRSGGSSCNQQPLDLSSAVSKRDEGLDKGPGEIVLDLSMHRKCYGEHDLNGGPATQPVAKRRKPNTSVLEKVLLNEYDGLEVAGEGSVGTVEASPPAVGEDSSTRSPHTLSSLCEESLCEEVVTSVALHPPPPSLTPVTLQPLSPCCSATGSPTPPPPVLPTAPSPDLQSEPSDVQLAHSPTQKSFPVVSPTISPSGVDVPQAKVLPAPDHSAHIMMQDVVNCGSVYQLTEPINSSEPKTHAFLSDPSVNQIAIHSASEYSLIGGTSSAALSACNIGSFNVTHRAVVIECTLSIEASQNLVSLAVPENPPTANLVVVQETKLEEEQKTPCQTPPQFLEPPVLVDSVSVPQTSLSQPVMAENPAPIEVAPTPEAAGVFEVESKLTVKTGEPGDATPPAASQRTSEVVPVQQETFFKSFTCNVCEKPFSSIKELSQHVGEHVDGWPFKCEFCVLLFETADALLEHRSTLHGVGKIYICSTCSKEFAFLCNLQQHQKDLHPGQNCSHTEVENGRLRPQNHNGPVGASMESSLYFHMPAEDDSSSDVKKEEDLDDSTEELYTTIKIMASEGGKPRGPNVKLGINQHYPSFKPPPFPYHNRTPAGSVASATNFTTHNIPQTFSTAIRCTKCGKSFVSMPDLHRHILACASASDKKRYTPKKNPIPLKEFVKMHNGALVSSTVASAGLNYSRRMGQSKRLGVAGDLSSKVKLGAFGQRKGQLVAKAMSPRIKLAATVKRSSVEEQEVYVCPHCNREFTYRGSLNKHVTVSCPMKPLPKKTRKGAGVNMVISSNRSGSLRRRTSLDMKLQGANLRKTLVKTRGQSTGAGVVLSLKHQPNRGKMAAQGVRPKRPATFLSSLVPPGKKSKMVVRSSGGLAPQQLPVVPLTLPPAATRTQRGDEDTLVRRPEEASLLQPLGQPRRDERVAVARMRVGGPVTRSLQLANAKGPTLLRAEPVSSQESREPQDPSVRLPG